MEGFEEVVFTEDTRVVAGTFVALFKAHQPRKVNPTLVKAALGMGAKLAPGPVPDPDPVEASEEPPPKKRRARRKKRTESVIISDAVEYMTVNQPSWSPEDYDLNKLPRMHLFKAAVPDLTPTLREAAWDIFVSGQRDA